MNNIRPFFRSASAPAPVKVSPVLRPFSVSIRAGSQPHVVNVLAFTSCDAICSAIDIFFDGNEPMPADGLEVSAHPMNLLPSAA